MEEINKIVIISNNDILPNRFQPRKYFDEEEILQLSESIKEHGVINPIIVRKLGDKYELVAGERRYKANILAGNDSIPTIVMDINDKESSEIAVVENVQRKDLNAIEEAIAYKRILDIGYKTQEQLAQKVGKSQSAIANKIRLLKLSDDVQDALMRKEISERHARSLLKIKSIKKQNEMLKRIIEERLTVRKLDEEIDKMNNNVVQDSNNQINDIVTPIQPSPIMVNNDISEFENNESIEMPNLSPIEENVTPIEKNEGISSVGPMNYNQGQENTFQPSQPLEVPGMSSMNYNPVQESAAQPEQPLEVSGMNSMNYNPVQESAAQPLQPLEAPGMNSMNYNPVKENVAQPVQPLEVLGMNSMNYNPVQESAAQLVQPLEIPGMNSMNYNPVQESAAQPVQPLEAPGMNSMNYNPVQESAAQPVQSIDMSRNTADNPFNNNQTFEFNKMDNKNSNPLFTSPIIDTTINNANNNNELSNNLMNNQSLTNQDKFETVKEPIITTDYNDQYDPIMPNVIKEPQIDFRTIINLIRECSSKIEKYGYKIETEEYNLDTLYQVVFKIEKKIDFEKEIFFC